MSATAEPFRSIIYPDDRAFANPASMTSAIKEYCLRTGQPAPETQAQFTRCIYESLALRYRQVFGLLREFADFPLNRLHVIGGGSRNALLNQMTADSLGVEVVAGPMECTAAGNIMVQAKAAGEVASLADMRAIIYRSNEMKVFHPADTSAWDAAYEKYLSVTNN